MALTKHDVLVVTGDKDFIQVVDDHVKLYDPMQDRHTGPAEVRERLGIEPSQMRDYLALVGDAIDNVAKIPGIGRKTAAELIHQFGTVEALLERLPEVKKPKLRDALGANVELLQRAKRLVTFKTDLPLEVRIQDLARRPIQDAAARDLFRSSSSSSSFKRCLERRQRHSPPRCIRRTRGKRWRRSVRRPGSRAGWRWSRLSRGSPSGQRWWDWALRSLTERPGTSRWDTPRYSPSSRAETRFRSCWDRCSRIRQSRKTAIISSRSSSCSPGWG